MNNIYPEKEDSVSDELTETRIIGKIKIEHFSPEPDTCIRHTEPKW